MTAILVLVARFPHLRGEMWGTARAFYTEILAVAARGQNDGR